MRESFPPVLHLLLFSCCESSLDVHINLPFPLDQIHHQSQSAMSPAVLANNNKKTLKYPAHSLVAVL